MRTIPDKDKSRANAAYNEPFMHRVQKICQYFNKFIERKV